jgi:hypothetical protein
MHDIENILKNPNPWDIGGALNSTCKCNTFHRKCDYEQLPAPKIWRASIKWDIGDATLFLIGILFIPRHAFHYFLSFD